MKNTDEMDFQWKLEAFRAALRIELETTNELNMNFVWTRTMSIYKKGYKEGLFEWSPVKDKPVAKEKIAVKKKEDVPEKTIIDGVEMKMCPDCGEYIKLGWKSHLFKKDGSKCGYVDQE